MKHIIGIDEMFGGPDYSIYFDKDIYSVVTEDGKKKLKMEYYFYKEDTIECVEFTFCYVDIPATRDEISEAEDNCKQYQGTVSAGEYMRECRKTLDKLEHLPIENVTASTPDGMYIDME